MSIVRQWRQRQRKGFADDGDAIPPAGRSPLHPLADKDALAKAEYEQKSKKEEGLCAALWLLQTEGKNSLQARQLWLPMKRSRRKALGK